MGFRGRVTTVGIDLGTTFSVVGVNFGGKKGVQIVTDKAGHNIFPSIISYVPGDILSLYEARAQLETNPENTIFNAKRFIGRTLDEESVQSYANSHSFHVVRSNASMHGEIGFQLTTSSGQMNSTTGEALVVTPIDIGSQVLKALLKITASFLGHNQVNKAVIAVPAKFNSQQRIATGEAYKKAGLKVVRVLEEPTAAAIAYKLHKKQSIHHILVYDFGGGTLDVSLLYVSKGSVQVYATDGDEGLGGSDLDVCLCDILRKRMDSLMPLYSESCPTPTLRVHAEALKKDLSSKEEVDFRCNSENGFKFSRKEFEDGCKDLFDRSMTPVTRLLEDLSMTKEDVDEVVLVGGTTRIPKVKQQLRNFFGKELNDHIDPDVTVAYGCASVLD